MAKTLDLGRAFASQEDGIALTEYLVLLGLLVGGVIAAVGLAGDNLALAWSSWSNFFDSEVSWDGTVEEAPTPTPE